MKSLTGTVLVSSSMMIIMMMMMMQQQTSCEAFVARNSFHHHSQLASSPTTTTATVQSSFRQQQQQQRHKSNVVSSSLLFLNSNGDQGTSRSNDVESKFDRALQTLDLKQANSLLVSSMQQNLNGENAVDGSTTFTEQQQQQQKEKGIELTPARWKALFDAIELKTSLADDDTAASATAVASPSTSSAEFPLESPARQEMTQLYETLSKYKQLRLFGAVGAHTHFPIEGSYSVSPVLLEQILMLPMSALTPEPTNTWLLAGIALAVLEGFGSVWSGIPLNVLVLATVGVATLDRLLFNGVVVESILKVFRPGLQTKILRHEAGHFLAAYLLGCPVEGCVTNAWAAYQDARFRNRAVSAGTSFFDPELSQQINRQAQVTRRSIDRYSIIVMAGIAAEADSYGRANGGAGDESALVAFLSQLNGGKTSSNGVVVAAAAWNNDTIRNQARWGAMQAVLLLREYKPAYEALVAALEKGGKLGDCIYAIEEAAQKHNLKALERPVGWITAENAWSKDAPAPEAAAAAVLPTKTGLAAAVRPTSFNGSSLSSSSSSSTAATASFDEDESLARLRSYREQVEAKLRSIEEQLEKLEE